MLRFTMESDGTSADIAANVAGCLVAGFRSDFQRSRDAHNRQLNAYLSCQHRRHYPSWWLQPEAEYWCADLQHHYQLDDE